jgi:CheY-like chemotaxis protein
MNGWEATRRLKAQQETRDIPVIVLTAHTSKRSRDDAVAAGCDDYDTKPIDFPGFLGKVQALLNRRAGA